MQIPEAYISNSVALFDDAGALVDDSARQFLSVFMQTFAVWIDTHTATSAEYRHNL
jgi:chromate reductase, NAD(P)H dehydrogenase (quinone)